MACSGKGEAMRAAVLENACMLSLPQLHQPPESHRLA